jgi:acetylornithine deacetylase/succinyl-diaminopimelate desuccinylase-like protein
MATDDKLARRLDAAVETGQTAAIGELARLCAVPSVSAKKQAQEPCAELVAELMRAHGLEASLMDVPGGPPVAFGTSRTSRADAPTVLFYNHYDVQPAEPLELWDSPPFELTLRDGCAFARGAADDKGHIASRLLALDAVRAAFDGDLPFHVKFVAEGEEEVGSPNLGGWVRAQRDLLQADYCIWESGGVNDLGDPSLYCGMRGIAYFELHARTIAYDAHSGVGGSLLPNAAWRLVWALASLKGADERILIPSYYDDVRPASPRDLALLAALPDDEEAFRQEYGLPPGGFLGGTATTGVEFQRRAVFEPTLTVCGLDSGWQGPGAKTVLPAEAHAKIDFRLVPDQDPDRVHAALRAHLDAQGFTDVEVRYLGGQRPARVDPDHPLVRLAAETAQEVYGRPASIVPIVGGSGPMWWFNGYLGLPVTSPGIDYPGVRAHSPNEHMRLSDFTLGTRHLAYLLAGLRDGTQVD